MSGCRAGPSAGSSQCRPPSSSPALEGLDAIVRQYIRDYRPRVEAELQSFALEPTVQAAVARAALARTPEGKRYSHQSRITRPVLAEARERLVGMRFGREPSFENLDSAVHSAIGSISGAGELLVYDTALRIGAKLRLYPERVYLHRGTRQGARALGLDWKKPSLSIEELPAAFAPLRPHEVEDCLCIFKDILK